MTVAFFGPFGFSLSCCGTPDSPTPGISLSLAARKLGEGGASTRHSSFVIRFVPTQSAIRIQHFAFHYPVSTISSPHRLLAKAFGVALAHPIVPPLSFRPQWRNLLLFALGFRPFGSRCVTALASGSLSRRQTDAGT